MFFLTLYVTLSTFLMAPVRPGPQDKTITGIEQEWYDELKRTGRLTIDIGDGYWLEVCGKETEQRRLINPTILVYNPMGLQRVLRPKVAEMRVSGTSVSFSVQECNINCTDGSSGYLEACTLQTHANRVEKTVQNPPN